MTDYPSRQDSSPAQGRKRASDPSGGEDVKRKRMDFGGGERGFGRGPDDFETPPATLRVLIRHSDAGGIIGRGGENIKRMRKTWGSDLAGLFIACMLYICAIALICLAIISLPYAIQVMTMMGTITSCCGVLGDTLSKVQQPEDSAEPHEVQILIPQPFMGTIIGSGGSKINELRERTGATVKIFQEPMPNSNERSIQVVGTKEQIIDCAKYFLEEISRKLPPREPIYLYEPGMLPSGPPGPPGPPPPQSRSSTRGFRGGRGGSGGFSNNTSGFGSSGGQRWNQGGGRGGRGGGFADRGRGRGGGRGGGRGRGRGWQNGSGTPGRSAQNSWQQSPSQPRPSYGSNGATGAAPTPLLPGTPPTQPSPVGQQQYNMPGSTPAPPSQPPRPTFPAPATSVGYAMTQPAVGYAATPPVQPQPRPPQANTEPPVNTFGVVPPAPTSYMPPQTGQPPPPTALSAGPPAVPPMAQQPPQQQFQQSQQVTIPYEYADAILGVGGSRLEMIKSQSSCQITMNDVKPGTNECIITIVGTPSSIQFAQQLMQNSVRQHHNV